MRGASSGTGESGEGEGAKDWGAWHVNLVETEPRKIRPSNGPQCVANFQAINGSGRGKKRAKMRLRRSIFGRVSILPGEVGY